MQPQNKRILLWVLVVLLILQFIVVPILAWQQEKISDIQANTKRLEKVNAVIKLLPQTMDALGAIKKQNKALEDLYYHNTSVDSLKLDFQQQIESLLEKHKLKVKNFRWVIEIPGELTELRAKVSFNGKVKNFTLFQVELAQHTKYLNIAEWTLSIKKMNETSLGDASGSLLLFTYHLPKKVGDL